MKKKKPIVRERFPGVEIGNTVFVRPDYCFSYSFQDSMEDVFIKSGYHIRRIFGDDIEKVTVQYIPCSKNDDKISLIFTLKYEEDYLDELNRYSDQTEYGHILYKVDGFEIDLVAWVNFSREMGGYDISGISEEVPKCFQKYNFL